MQKLVSSVIAAVVFAGFSNAQVPVYSGPPGESTPHLKGFNLYDVSGSVAYLTGGLPGTQNTALVSPNGLPFDSNYFGTTSVTVGWESRQSRSSSAIYYTPSYTANTNYPDMNAVGHSLVVRFGTPRRLSQKWRFNFGVDANISSFQQYIFTPTAYSNIVSAPSTLQDLSGTGVNGGPSSDQLTAIANGAPIADSPVRGLFFGDRILTAGARATFSYVPRSRWTVDFDLSGARTQHLSSPKQDAKSTTPYITPYVNSEQVSMAASYSFSPKMRFGVVVVSNRSFTGFQDAYAQTALATFSRTFGRHLFLSIQAGGGVIVPVKDKFNMPTTMQSAGGITAGVKTRSSTFLITTNRTIGDNYGTGNYATIATNAAWNYARPGSKWWLYAAFGQNWLQGSQLHNVHGWTGWGGVGRRLGNGFLLQTQYSALTYGAALGPQYDFAIQSARIVVSWTPHSEFFQ